MFVSPRFFILFISNHILLMQLYIKSPNGKVLQRPAVAPLIGPLDLGPVKKTYLRRQVGGVAPDCSQRGQRQQHKPTFDYLLRCVLRGTHSMKKITTWYHSSSSRVVVVPREL